MHPVLRLGAAAAALALVPFGVARADQLVWFFTSDEASAYLALRDAAMVDEEESDAPFSMSCSITGDEETIVSGVDAKALGAAISADQTPSFHFIVNGQPEQSGDAIADIHLNQMSGAWEYLVNGALDYALKDAQTATIEGVGINLTLPPEGLAENVKKFRDACDAMMSAGPADEGDDPGDDSGGDTAQ